MKPGTLLISQPFLGDPNFERSVVLLCRDAAAHGTFGLVLGRPAALTLHDVLDLPRGAHSPAAALPLYRGGPVGPDTLHCLHRRPDVPRATSLGDDVYWGGDFDVLLGLLTRGRTVAWDAQDEELLQVVVPLPRTRPVQFAREVDDDRLVALLLDRLSR